MEGKRGRGRIGRLPCMRNGGGGLPCLAAPSSGEEWKGSERVGEEKESERGRLTGGLAGERTARAGGRLTRVPRRSERGKEQRVRESDARGQRCCGQAEQSGR